MMPPLWEHSDDVSWQAQTQTMGINQDFIMQVNGSYIEVRPTESYA